MKNNMEEIDNIIKETLTEEEAAFYDSLDEQNVFEMVRGLFQTKNRWIIILMNIVHIISVILMVYCIVQFYNAEATKDLIQWASGGFICLIMGAMLKLFSWMQIDKNAILREMKRLELQVAALSHQNDKKIE